MKKDVKKKISRHTYRKQRPVFSGVLNYFPLAVHEVAHVSFVGNEQHNPGKPMFWDKPKSPDHKDCCVRHLIDSVREPFDSDGLRHAAKAAWRALANLEIELENEQKNEQPRKQK